MDAVQRLDGSGLFFFLLCKKNSLRYSPAIPKGLLSDKELRFQTPELKDNPI